MNLQKSAMLNRYEEQFHATLIFPGTWMISTKSAALPYSCDCYLVEGDECAIALDSGMAKLDIHEFMGLITPLPILGVVNTHSHFDHTGGNGFFPKAYMHPLAEQGAKTPFGAKPGDTTESGYPLDYPVAHVREGHIFELGNRTLEVIEIGAHDLSSIALLDSGRRILFSGDELETGWCNVGCMGEHKRGMTIETHFANMKKLKTHWNEFDAVCPAHHGAPVSKELLNHVLTADRMILDGATGDPNMHDKNGGGMFRGGDIRAMRYKMAHMGYSIKHVYEEA